jgi:RpiB/LacA/LacB family sugar-phosphate isomerase
MKIAVGSDHAGFELKKQVKKVLADLKHQVIDLGTHSTKAVDYPDYAEAVGLAVQDGKAERGILVCGSGVGASVAANKVPGVRAGLCHDHYSAHQGVEHDDMNVLVMGGRVIGESVALELVRAFLGAQFTHEERHQRRLQKLKAIEQRHAGRGEDRGTRGVRPSER